MSGFTEENSMTLALTNTFVLFLAVSGYSKFLFKSTWLFDAVSIKRACFVASCALDAHF